MPSRMFLIVMSIVQIVIAAAYAPVASAADWPTHRANPQRTGAADNQPGPRTAHVLWVFESQDHFIASPVIGDGELIVSGLGAFNTASIRALSLDPAAPKCELWSKSAPYLHQAVVSPPAAAEGKLIFGDGMHTDQGGTLHCLTADGRPVWQLAMPGTLIHMEGGPTVLDGKAYTGGGAAGVIAVDIARVELEGVEMDLPAVQKRIDEKWKQMQEKYEAAKKKDPDFAVPPNEDNLPKPAPKLLWQTGKDIWHVDASVAVIGGNVLAASAYLDDEKLGDRALFCMDAADGKIKWRTPLDFNPWGGPTVSDQTVVIGCSNIRYDPKSIQGGQGQVVAVNLADGAVEWKKDLGGGVLSPVVAVGELAIFTCTDGSVHAVALADGQEKWSYAGKSAFFAAPALGGDVAYVADLAGVVTALSLGEGKPLWTLDLASDPAVKAPGMVYGSPVLAGGRLYVATCNLQTAQQRTVVVCIGEK